MKIAPECVLVISPHTDDAEVAAGGAISRFLREGREVHVLALALAHDADWEEFENSMECLEVRHTLRASFPVRRFNERRQDVLDELIYARDLIKPDLVIAPSLRDMHQDHQVVAQETLRAFKNGCSILGFSYPWNTVTFNTTCFIKISEADLGKKLAAIEQYESQEKDYMRPEFIRAWALTTGVAVGAKYAECFEVARLTC